MSSPNPPSMNSDLTPDQDAAGSNSMVPADATTPGPMMCLLWLPVSCASGAAMGSMFGFGAGLLKKKGLKGSVTEAGSNAKTFAIMSGVDQLVSCLLGKLRGKDDAYNAGIAGCCSGLAVSFPGSPKSLIQTCVAYGVLSFFFQRIDIRQRPASASSQMTISKKKPNQTRHSSVLLHLQFPLPDHLKEAFSSFYDSLKWKSNPIPTATGGNKFSTSSQ